MSEIILIQATGEDSLGITASITEVLANYDIDILDIGQSVIHNQLVLGILIKIPEKSESAPVLKDILLHGYQHNVAIKFTPTSAKSYEKWQQEQGKARHIITIVGKKISGKILSQVSSIIARASLNIDNIRRLTGRIPLNEDLEQYASLELSVRGIPKNSDQMKASFLDLAAKEEVDIALQEDNGYRRNRRLIVFDMDSTLIQTEVIDELAKAAGSGEMVSAITESAMRGEIDFKESLRKRLKTLKGLDESVMQEIAARLPITPGAKRLISNLKKHGYKTAILSGGFTYFGKELQKIFGIDYVFANQLVIEDGKLTGEVSGFIVDGAKKAELLTMLCEKENINLQQSIAVGDGANDLPMLKIAGLGIAYHAKPKVKADARQSISNFGLDSILYLTGLKDSEID